MDRLSNIPGKDNSEAQQDYIKGLWKGDLDAFNYFFNEFYAPLLYYCKHYVDDGEEAKDIVLKSFYKLWKKKETFETHSHVKSFLYLVIKNASLDYLKVKQRTVRKINEFSMSAPLLQQADAYLEMEAEVLKKIYTEIERLPEKCKAVFKLSYLEGKSTAEIAAALQITPGNVSSQKHRAIQLLRLALKDSPYALMYLLIAFLDR